MAGPASSRTVSASTDSPVSTPSSASAASRAAAPVFAAWHTGSERVSHLWTTPGWRRGKSVADRVLLFVIAWAVAWAVVNGVFVAQRASTNRAVALVHLASQPAVRIERPGTESDDRTTLPTEVLSGTQTERISIAVANDSPDGVVLKSGTLTGPYLTGAVRLVPDATGYIVPTGAIHLTGTVTVDCDAAAQTASALTDGRPSPEHEATTVAISVADPNGTVHHVNLVIDTTAYAVQGQVCTS